MDINTLRIAVTVIRLPLFLALVSIWMRIFSTHCINIHPGHFGIRESFLQLFFNFFCPEISLHKLITATGGAGMHGRVSSTAIMAN